MRGVLMAALAAVIPAVAAAQDPEFDTPPGWLKKPTMNDLVAVWPREAMLTGRGGKAVIGCAVSAEGTLYDCHVVEESPAGAGFGGAAVTVASQLLMKPAMKAGKPVRGAKVRIPVNFPDFGTPAGSRTRSAAGLGITRKVISEVAWKAAPTYADMAAAYPAKARAKGVGGNVVLSCRLSGEGRLRGCETVRATPNDLGFAQAARELAQRFQGPTTLADGRSVSGLLVQVPFTFSIAMLNDGAPVIGKPDWARLPSGEDLKWPEAAAKAGSPEARVVLTCRVA